MNASRTAWLALLAGVVLCAGCGPAANSHPTAKLAGHVTIDGQQIDVGQIQFMPLGKGPGSGQLAEGTIAQGSYSADRVPTGKVRVIFAALRKTGKMIHEGDYVFPEEVSMIPEKYQQGIEIDVSGDNPSQDFNLDSKSTSPGSKSGTTR
jgi:hypothetical protein